MTPYKWLFIFLGFLILSSCGAIRKANRIEYLFLDNYIKDTKNGQPPKGYSVRTSYLSGTTTINSAGNVHQGLGTYTIDATLIDTINNLSYAIDNGKGIFKLVKDNKACEPYYKKYLHQKRWKHIGRYGSIAAMGFGITIMASIDPNDASKDKIGNLGAFTFIGGFFDWIGGGLTRISLRRTTVMQAAYVYQFGPLPKHLPRISKAAKWALLQSNPMFRR